MRISGALLAVWLPAAGCLVGPPVDSAVVDQDSETPPTETTPTEPTTPLVAALDAVVRLDDHGACTQPRPAVGAEVTVRALAEDDGEQTTSTDAAGFARFAEVVTGPLLVGAVVPDVTTQAWELAEVPATGGTGAAVTTLRTLQTYTVVKANRGGAVGRVDEFALEFGPLYDVASLPATTDAVAAAGPADVKLRWFEAGEAGVPPAGDWTLFAALYVGGATAGAVDVWPDDPVRLRLSTESTDAVRDAAGVRALRFDPEVAGAWVDEGPVVEEDNYVTATFSEPGWWAIGAPVQDLGCVTGTLEADGEVVAGAAVHVTVPGELGSRVVTSGADGSFCAPVPIGAAADANILGFAADGSTLFTAEAVLDAPTALGSCGGECVEAPDLALAADADADEDSYFAGAGGDCDDSSDLFRPSAAESRTPDGADTNCDCVDGVDADRDGVRSDDGTGGAIDCDDEDPARYPDAAEVCNEVDDDCDGAKDEGVPSSIVAVAGSTCLKCDKQSVFALNPFFYWSLDEVDAEFARDSSGHGVDLEVGTPFGTYAGITHELHETPYFRGLEEDHLKREVVEDWPSTTLTLSLHFRAVTRGAGLISYSWSDQATAAPVVHDNEFMVYLLPGAGTDALHININDERLKVPIGEVPDLTLGAWHHLVITWQSTGGAITVWLDGAKGPPYVLVDENGDPVEVEIQDGGALYLGQEQNDYAGGIDLLRAFRGMMDEVLLFDRVLTDDEIELLGNIPTCGEGVLRNGEDNDGDGDVDEHLYGTEALPALDCAEIENTLSSIGDGWYVVDPPELDPLPAYCDMTTGTTSYCGDGVVFAPYESCDEDSATCNGCARVVAGAAHCEDVLEIGQTAPDGPYADGPYVVDLGGEPTRVRCDQSNKGGGWTLVYDHDLFGKEIFKCEADALASSVDDPFHHRYSILGRLADLDPAMTGWQFRMEWPWAAQEVNFWRQDSDPTVATEVTGFLACDVQATQHGFEGLYRSPPPVTEDCTCFPLSSYQDGTPTECSIALIEGGADPTEDWYTVAMFGPNSDLAYAQPETLDLGGDGSTVHTRLWARSAAVGACE